MDGPAPKEFLVNKIALAAAVTLAVAHVALAEAPRSPTPQHEADPFKLTTIAKGLENPWGLALLPDGRYLVTERPGRLRLVAKDGTLSAPLGGLPMVYAKGQGGLLDITLSPKFAADKLVYFSFSEPGDGGAGTAVGRGKLGE
jgi:glucose/arabinose dehydrogenase